MLRFVVVCAALAIVSCDGAPSTSQRGAALIECNSTTIDQPCDTDDTVCTPEVCRQIGLGIECVASPVAADGTACESDGLVCTGDACSAGVCVHTPLPEGSACIDGLFCTTGERCDAVGICGDGLATCDDGSACTTDACDETIDACSHDGIVCDDGNGCTGNDCAPVGGCFFPPLGAETACNDGLFCSVADRCDGAGGCTGALGCIDDNPCTIDTCNETAELCSNVIDGGATCNDGNACTDGDLCDGLGACGGAPVLDGTPCAEGGGCLAGGNCSGGLCDGTQPLRDGTPCGDDNACTAADVCAGGACAPGDELACDDGEECTIDGCDPVEGCVTQTIDGCEGAPDAGMIDGGGSSDGGATLDGGGSSDGGATLDGGGTSDGGATLDGGGTSDGGAPFAGELGGGGCAAIGSGTGAPGGGLAIGLVAVALGLGLGGGRRRRQRTAIATALLAMMAVAAVSAQARADGFDAVTFRPAPAASAFFSQDGPAVLRRGGWRVGLAFDLARDLLVVRDPDSGEVLMDGEVVSQRAMLHLGAAFGLPGGIEVAADLPLALAQDGELTLVSARPDDELGATRLGDLRLHGKLALGRHLALAATVGIPTGSADDFTGDGALSLTPRLIVGVERGRLALAASVGYRLRSAAATTNLAIDDELVAGLAGSVRVSGRVSLLAEAYLAAGVSGDSGERALPVEGLAGIRWAISGPWTVQLGAGAGLSHGYGAPSGRGVLMVAFAPPPPAAPRPLPPIEVVRAEPPAPAPEPVPEPAVVAPVPADADGDGIVDADDKCPDQPEVVNGVDDQDGCPDEGLIELIDDRIVLEERVLFDTDRARVRHNGKLILAAVLTLWGQHPEWERMIIEGHTDSRGAAAYNETLGAQRASRVRDVLLEQGVPAEKLEVQSFGEARPRVEGTSDEARAKNRRVELVIIKKVPKAIPTETPPAPKS